MSTFLQYFLTNIVHSDFVRHSKFAPIFWILSRTLCLVTVCQQDFQHSFIQASDGSSGSRYRKFDSSSLLDEKKCSVGQIEQDFSSFFALHLFCQRPPYLKPIYP